MSFLSECSSPTDSFSWLFWSQNCGLMEIPNNGYWENPLKCCNDKLLWNELMCSHSHKTCTSYSKVGGFVYCTVTAWFTKLLFCLPSYRMVSGECSPIHIQQTFILFCNEQLATKSTIHKAVGSLVTGHSLQNGKNCCWQEWPSATILLFTVSQIFRNCASQTMEWPGTIRLVALWIVL